MSDAVKVRKNGRWVRAFGESRVVDDSACVAFWDARYYDPISDSLIDLSGNGHHARFGSVGGGSAGIRGGPGTKYLYLPGGTNSKNYAYTPAGVGSALDITGDIAIAVHIEREAPTDDRALVIRRQGAVDSALIPYNFGQWHIGVGNETPTLKFVWTDAGGTTHVTYMSVEVPTYYTHVGVTHDVDNGAGGNVVTFYGSVDGVVWTQIQSITNSGTTSHRSNAAQVGVGGTDAGVYGAVGKYYRARIWNAVSFDGDPVADFNPNDDTSPYGLGPVVSSTTGEAWTLDRSAADTNDPLLLPYEGEKYLYLPGVTDNHALGSGLTPLSSAATLEFRVRVQFSPDASGTNSMSGWQSTHAQFNYYPDVRRLLIQAIGSGSVFIGGSYSSSGLPVVPGEPVWLRGRLTYATARCEYWYSHDSTNDPDAVSWTPCGDVIGANAGVSPVFTNSATPLAGAATTGGPGMRGGLFVASESVDGVERWRFDASRSVEPHTSFVAATGETWTINRTTTGRKAVLVDRPLLLFGTDDRLEVADHADLDFGTSPFSAVAVFRDYGNAGGVGRSVMEKRNSYTTAGWMLFQSSSNGFEGRVSDGVTTGVTSPRITEAPGAARALALVVSASDARSMATVPASETGANSTAVAGSVSNAEALTIGDGVGFAKDMEFIGAAIFRKALTDAQLASVAAEFGIT